MVGNGIEKDIPAHLYRQQAARGNMFSGCPSVRCPHVNVYFALRDISVLMEWISMRLGNNTCIHRMSGLAG